jgi:hypothetical protein
MLCLIVLLPLFGMHPSAAATLTVGSSSYPTIGSAVGAAQHGDIVLVPDGTYTGSGNVDIDFQGKAITVQSVNGPASTVIDCGGTLADPHGAFIFQSGEGSDSVLQGFTIQNANQVVGNYGGAIAMYASSPTILQCDFANNTGYSGAAINIDDGSPWISQCVFSGNSATTGASTSNGGAIEVVTDNAYANPVLEDCVFLNNNADGDGGAIDLASYINPDTTGISLVNCSFYGNTASGDGYSVDANDEPGAIDFYQSTGVISNCIFSGNSSPTEISTLNPPDSPIIEDSDIVQAGYAGTHGNIDADPQYVHAATGVLQLMAASPCIGTGMPITGVTTDILGNPRPNPPSMGAYEAQTTAIAVSAAADSNGNTRVLWDLPDGKMQIWTVASDGTYTSTPLYGPYAGWIPKSLAVAALDDTTHLFWNNTNGEASIWTIASDGTYASTPAYGPYPGWTATGLAAAADGTDRLLWNYASGAASIWTIASDGTFTSTPVFGPYAGWTTTGVGVDATGNSHLLWNNTDGQTSIWTVASDGSFTSTPAYGPYGGWMTTGLATASDGTDRLLWNYDSVAVSIWTVASDSTFTSTSAFGPYIGWTETALSVAPDGTERLLWDNTDGSIAVWTVAADGSYTTTPVISPPQG